MSSISISDQENVVFMRNSDQGGNTVITDTTASRALTGHVAVACLFWLLCLTLTAAGHRLYKATVAVDHAISSEAYQSDGAPLVWVGYGSINGAAKRLPPDMLPVDVSKLTTLPASAFIVFAVVGFTLMGALLAWYGRWIVDTGIQSLVGVFAGHLLWLGAIEFGLALAARQLGLAGSLKVVEGRVVGIHGGGTLIQLSVVFLVPVLIGLTIHESNRCAVFQWFRRRLPIARTAAASGRVENYAARTAIQYFMTVWFCYVSVLWLADPRLGSVGQIALLMTLITIAAATPYMIWRTARQPSYSSALRYSVSGAVVAWTGIEIAAAMRFFHEPWLSDSLSSGAILLGLTILLTVLAARSLWRSRAVRLGSTLGLIAVALGIAGCSQADDPTKFSATEVENRLREYDARIQKPQSTSHDGLLHALGSADPEMRAQAALAFGKSRQVDSVVKEQLHAMAANDDSRLSQFAALAALHKLDLASRDLQNILSEFSKDPAWRSVVEYVRNRREPSNR